MKQLMQLSACIALIWLAAFTSCEKEKEEHPDINKAPIAKAGQDISIFLASCSDRNGAATLDGSASADPDNNIKTYRWRQLDGPEGAIIQNPTSAKTRIENISVGNSTFQLSIQDAQGWISNDEVVVTAKGPANDYELDITTEAAYRFTDNFEDCYYGCTYYDLTQINGTGIILPFGAFNVYISEIADTAVISDEHSTSISIYAVNGNIESVSGTCSINLKKLMRDGGGTFNGSFKAQQGSALICGENALDSLPLLNVSGSLDVITRMIKITIKGKVYL